MSDKFQAALRVVIVVGLAVVGWSLYERYSSSSVPLVSPPSRTKEVRIFAKSYYPHWATRSGEMTDSVMDSLPPYAIIAVHHTWSVGEISRILQHPKKFVIAWYAESNVWERDDPSTGVPVRARIEEARRKQDILLGSYHPGRFANLFELDAATEKSPTNRLMDAKAVQDNGFTYIAKSQTREQIEALRRHYGVDFLTRVVFEDVTAELGDSNQGYRARARDVARRGYLVTLIIHSGAYGGFKGTSLEKAKEVVREDFNYPNVEAYWGQPNRVTHIKHFDLRAPVVPK